MVGQFLVNLPKSLRITYYPRVWKTTIRFSALKNVNFLIYRHLQIAYDCTCHLSASYVLYNQLEDALPNFLEFFTLIFLTLPIGVSFIDNHLTIQ